jgi:hypothetical protein
MRNALIQVNEIPQSGAATADLLGLEVLVMLPNGKPRGLRQCLLASWRTADAEVTPSHANGTAPSTTYAPAVRLRDRSGQMHG